MNKKEVVFGLSPESTSSRLDNTVTNNKKLIDVVFKTEPTIATNNKVILCGHHIETYQYEKPLVLNRKPKAPKKKFQNQDKDWLLEAQNYIRRRDEYRKRTKSRVIGQVQRLIESNFNKDSIFLTLTFNNKNNFNINDLTVCNPKLHNFMVNLKTKFSNLKYLIVPEFQKRGAVHYHLIINQSFIEKELIQKIWKYGFVKVKDIYYLEGIGNYFTKYLTKNSDDIRLQGRRAFFTSKNLHRPKIVYGEFAEKIINRLKEKEIKPYWQNEYKTEFNGAVKYSKHYIEGKI